MSEVSSNIPELVDSYLSQGNEQAQCLGRLLATDVMQLSQLWLNAELKRGTHPVTICVAVISMAVFITGSVQGQELAPGDDDKAIEHFANVFKQLMQVQVAGVRGAADAR